MHSSERGPSPEAVNAAVHMLAVRFTRFDPERTTCLGWQTDKLHSVSHLIFGRRNLRIFNCLTLVQNFSIYAVGYRPQVRNGPPRAQYESFKCGRWFGSCGILLKKVSKADYNDYK